MRQSVNQVTRTAIWALSFAITFALVPATASAAAGPDGAYLVRDIAPGEHSGSPQNLVEARGRVFFAADDWQSRPHLRHGTELWVSNGTRKGTRLVKDIRRGHASSRPQPIGATSSGSLFFWANDGKHGTELWITDGTSKGTRLVKDIWRRPKAGNISQGVGVVAGKNLYFTARDHVNGWQLWKSDGTNAGTIRLTTHPRNASHEPEELTVMGDRLYFVALHTATSYGLWKSDGTAASTVPVANVYFEQLTDVRGTLFGITDGELWKSDGTTAGSSVVKDVAPGSITKLTSAGGRVYFTAYEGGPPGRRLWTSDGTAGGTRVVRGPQGQDFYPDEDEMTAVGTRLYFPMSANLSGSRSSLWRTDATPAGTVKIKTLAGFRKLTVARSKLFFSGTRLIPPYGSREELWMSDGTAQGTIQVSRLDIDAPVAAARRLFFVFHDRRHGSELWATRPASR